MNFQLKTNFKYLSHPGFDVATVCPGFVNFLNQAKEWLPDLLFLLIFKLYNLYQKLRVIQK